MNFTDKDMEKQANLALEQMELATDEDEELVECCFYGKVGYGTQLVLAVIIVGIGLLFYLALVLLLLWPNSDIS